MPVPKTVQLVTLLQKSFRLRVRWCTHLRKIVSLIILLYSLYCNISQEDKIVLKYTKIAGH